MTKISRMTMWMLAGAALPLLAGCGASGVSSPGENPDLSGLDLDGGSGGGGGAGGSAFTGTMPSQYAAAGFVDLGVDTALNRRVFQMPATISGNFTMQNIPGVVYRAFGPVNVGADVGGDGTKAGGNPVTLTIEPGTVVYGEAGSNYVVVNRGSKIMAVGTPTQPIIFTSRQNIEGKAEDSSQGQWGGVILLGRAPVSNCDVANVSGTAACEAVIEGTSNSRYGGATATDDSGMLRYVQIRYSGTAIAPGNELQGLTLGGVGSGTVIDHVQIHNSSDDGVEIFGGTAKLKNVVITGADDDALDTDVGYRGSIQFVIAVQRDASNGDSMIEADSNNNEDDLPRQLTKLANFTFVQRSTVQGLNAVLIRGGADYIMANGVVTGPSSCIDIDETAGTTTRAADTVLQDIGPPQFYSVQLACATAFRSESNVPAATIQTIFTSAPSTGNSFNFTASLTNVFINGANEAGVTAFDAATLDPDFFVTTNYIGAVRDANDTWYAGWTCNPASAAYVDFGPTSGSCETIPST